MTLESMLNKNVKKADLLKVNKGLAIQTRGTKADLIKALLAVTEASPTRTLNMFNKEVLQDICRKIGSSPYGTKEELVKRIYSKELRPGK